MTFKCIWFVGLNKMTFRCIWLVGLKKRRCIWLVALKKSTFKVYLACWTKEEDF